MRRYWKTSNIGQHFSWVVGQQQHGPVLLELGLGRKPRVALVIFKSRRTHVESDRDIGQVPVYMGSRDDT